MRQIALINQSTIHTDGEVASWAKPFTAFAALVAAAWGVEPATVTATKTAPTGAWAAYVMDTSDQQGALGYHEADGLTPVLRAFAKDCRDDGASITVDLTHEIAEAMVDPLCVLGVDLGNGSWVGYEPGDPVEDDSYGFRLDGILCSDFVYPAWFIPGAKGRMDYTNHLGRPLAMLPGGYVSLQRKGQWGQQDAPAPSGAAMSRRRVNSRRIDVRRDWSGENTVEMVERPS